SGVRASSFLKLRSIGDLYHIVRRPERPAAPSSCGRRGRSADAEIIHIDIEKNKCSLKSNWRRGIEWRPSALGSRTLMAMWQWGLLLLAIVWALQSLGVWMQMRHYSDVFKGISNRYKDGFVGAGNVKGRLHKGTIVLIVVTPDLVVRRLLVMSGRSVFTKFKRQEQFEGVALDVVRSDPAIMGEGE